MKFDIMVLPSVPGTLAEREALRPIGRNVERYQQMIQEVRRIAIYADEMGFDVFSTTEHHFHSEGFEASVNPLLIYTDLAARTKRIKFAPLGLVLPTWDPLRIAEDLAILDHLTQGRIIAGFARGYQDRWSNIMGQQYHVGGTPMDGSAMDKHNRAVYEELFRIVKMAWLQDTIEYDGQYYHIPQPYKEGITRWPATEWTRKYGADELDEKGIIRRISVIPKPYQQPHPPIWQPFSLSENTIRWTAREEIVPWLLHSYRPTFVRWCRIYQEEAALAGRNLTLGESVGASRSICIGKTYEEAFNLGLRTAAVAYHDYLSNFGFVEVFRNPGEQGEPPLRFSTREQTFQRMIDHEYAIVGTVDDVKRKIEALATCYGEGALEWFGWLFYPQGLATQDEADWQLETFATKIMPEFRD